MYSLLRPLLFSLPPEVAHDVTLKLLSIADSLHYPLWVRSPESHRCQCMGISFPNRIGLSAGLDKNAQHVRPLFRLGFGFVEVGTVTPKPQAGNPKPRLFRLTSEKAIINKMGFNNAGLDAMVQRLSTERREGVLGVNIGKNKATPNENAVDDYRVAMRAVYPFADYIAVNLSSPNTPGLRELQSRDSLERLLSALKSEQLHLKAEQGRNVPLVVKIAPDLSEEALDEIAQVLLANEIEGVIATNTTLSRPLKLPLSVPIEGGLSGAPLKTMSTNVVRQLASQVKGKIAIIASGGVMSVEDAEEKRTAGADLVQLYTGLVYKGPALIKALVTRPL